jgi:hypothetical protein
MAIEFKYDRANIGGTDQNRTQRAGSFMNDILRLAVIPNDFSRHNYFIYITDNEMNTYFNNSNNRLEALYNLDNEARYEIKKSFITTFPRSFTDCLDRDANCVVVGQYKHNLAGNNFIRIFNVAT